MKPAAVVVTTKALSLALASAKYAFTVVEVGVVCVGALFLKVLILLSSSSSSSDNNGVMVVVQDVDVVDDDVVELEDNLWLLRRFSDPTNDMGVCLGRIRSSEDNMDAIL
jgi:hypothetical protein